MLALMAQRWQLCLLVAAAQAGWLPTWPARNRQMLCGARTLFVALNVAADGQCSDMSSSYCGRSRIESAWELEQLEGKCEGGRTQEKPLDNVVSHPMPRASDFDDEICSVEAEYNQL